MTAYQRASLIYWGSKSNETPQQFAMKNYWVWLYIPTFFSQMNPMELNLSPQLMLPYIPPWNISTQCSAWRLFGSPVFQRQFPVPFGWFLQAFVSLDQHHLCEKYLKPMNHRLLLSALCWSDVIYCPKIKVRKMAIFKPKPWVNPLEKCQFLDFLDRLFL